MLFRSEHAATVPAEKDKLNDLAREHYTRESQQLIDQLNQLVPDGETKLKAPDLKFNRSIGEHVGKFLHAASLAYANTGDPKLRDKLDRVVRELLKTQEPDGYLGTYIPAKRWGLFPDADWDVYRLPRKSPLVADTNFMVWL